MFLNLFLTIIIICLFILFKILNFHRSFIFFSLNFFFFFINFSKKSIFFSSESYKFIYINELNRIIRLIFLYIFLVRLIFFLKPKKIFFILFSINLLILSFLLFDNVFIFFSLFELRVIPLFFLILIYGLNPERFKSLFFLYIYIYVRFFPSLWSFIITYTFLLEKELRLVSRTVSLKILNSFIFFFIILTFLVKIPCFLFHSWLPKAHTESPSIGSIILARIYLKIGSFGLLKIENFIFNLNSNKFFSLIFILGGLLIRIYNSFQRDRKRIIANSSVVHLSLFVGIYFLKILNNFIFIVLIIGHRLVSIILFSLNYQIYKKFLSRSLMKINSLNLINPKIIYIFLFLSVINFSFPGTIRFWREIIIFCIFFKRRLFFLVIVLILIFFILLYSINVINFKIHSPQISNFFKDIDFYSHTNRILFYFSSFPVVSFFLLII